MYSNILVPISFDDDAKAQAAMTIARALSDDAAQITLLHVMEHVPAYAITYLPEEYLHSARRAVQAELDDMAAKLGHATGLVIEGHAGRAILDWAESNKPDLIVIASHRPGMQDLFLGSTASQVVRHAACAVHVLR